MDLRDLVSPRALLVALVLTFALTLVVIASTSTTAFGLYNTGWDGSAELRELTTDDNTTYRVAESTRAYTRVQSNGSFAFILAPEQAYTDTALTRIRSFVESGGTLLVASDVDPTGNELLAALGARARIERTLLRDEQHYYEQPAMPVATNVSADPLTAGVEHVTLNYGSPVVPNGARVLVGTAPSAYVDLDRDGRLDEAETPTSWPVVTVERVGEGRVIAVGDPSIFINAMLEREGNRRLVESLTADSETVLLDTSHTAGVPLLVTVQLAIQDTPGLQVLTGLLLFGLVGLATGRPLQRLRRDGQPPAERARPSEADLRAIVERQHPEWDANRVERVVKGVTRTDDDDRVDD